MGRGRAVRRAAALLKQATAQGAAQPSNAVPVFDIGASCMGARCFVTALARRNVGKPAALHLNNSRNMLSASVIDRHCNASDAQGCRAAAYWTAGRLQCRGRAVSV